MAEALKVGYVGLDTSHVVAFASLLNDEKNEQHVPGARVVAGYSKVSPDFEMSWKRADGFTKELAEKYGVQIMDSAEAVAEAVDLLMIMSVDGRVHLEQFRQTVKYRRPTYIDKPLALASVEAREILRLAREAGVPVMSSSALRYAQPLTDALAGSSEEIVGCDVFGPMAEQATQPGWFWYGLHSVEMLVTALGPGCRQVRAHRNENSDVATLIWADGRTATLRGLRNAHSRFGITLHRKSGPQSIDASGGTRHMYTGLVEAIVRSLPSGRSDVPEEQMLEVVRILEAANASRATGEVVYL